MTKFRKISPSLRDYYNDYKRELSKQINDVKANLKLAIKDRDIVLKRLNAHFKTRVDYSTSRIAKLNNKLIRFYGTLLDRERIEHDINRHALFIANYPITVDTNPDDLYAICKMFRQVADLRILEKHIKIVNKLDIRLTTLKGLTLLREDYFKMVNEYDSVGRKIIANGGSYTISNNFGYIIAARLPNYIHDESSDKAPHPASVDWEKTKALKELYIKDGIIPYKHRDYLTAQANGEDYTGKKFYIYCDKDYVHLFWNGVTYKNVSMNVKRYKFRHTAYGRYMNVRNELNEIALEATDVFNFIDNGVINSRAIPVKGVIMWLYRLYPEYADTLIANKDRFPFLNIKK